MVWKYSSAIDIFFQGQQFCRIDEIDESSCCSQLHTIRSAKNFTQWMLSLDRREKTPPYWFAFKPSIYARKKSSDDSSVFCFGFSLKIFRPLRNWASPFLCAKRTRVAGDWTHKTLNSFRSSRSLRCACLPPHGTAGSTSHISGFSFSRQSVLEVGRKPHPTARIQCMVLFLSEVLQRSLCLRISGTGLNLIPQPLLECSWWKRTAL